MVQLFDVSYCSSHGNRSEYRFGTFGRRCHRHRYTNVPYNSRKIYVSIVDALASFANELNCVRTEQPKIAFLMFETRFEFLAADLRSSECTIVIQMPFLCASGE